MMDGEGKLLGACGLYCGACGIYLAPQYPELAAELAKDFKCRPEQIQCDGCHGDLTSRWCDEKCAHWAKAEIIDGFHVCQPKDAKGSKEAQRQNLTRIREVGSKQWLEEQKEHFYCRQCGSTIIDWNHTCPNCGTMQGNS